MSEHFFTGKTQADRELRLFYVHTGFKTYDTEDGPYDDPVGTEITGTIDGTPIRVDGVKFSATRGQQSVTVRTDQRTFTALSSEGERSHSDVLRRYLEARPSDGWQVDIVDTKRDGDEWEYIVSISNEHLVETAEFRVSDQFTRMLANDGPLPPSDEAVRDAIAEAISRDDWSGIQHRAKQPTTLLWRAY